MTYFVININFILTYRARITAKFFPLKKIMRDKMLAITGGAYFALFPNLLQNNNRKR